MDRFYVDKIKLWRTKQHQRNSFYYPFFNLSISDNKTWSVDAHMCRRELGGSIGLSEFSRVGWRKERIWIPQIALLGWVLLHGTLDFFHQAILSSMLSHWNEDICWSLLYCVPRFPSGKLLFFLQPNYGLVSSVLGNTQTKDFVCSGSTEYALDSNRGAD